MQLTIIKYLVAFGLVAGAFYGVYFAGQRSVQVKWDKAKEEVKVKVEIQRVVQDKITYLTNTVYVDRVKEVKVKGDTIYVKVPQYITIEDNAACRINNGFIRLYNNAIANTVPGPADETDRAPSGVNLSEVVDNAAINYTTCNIYKERALAWEQWAKEQKENRVK